MSTSFDRIDARAEAMLDAQAEADEAAYEAYVYDLVGDDGWLGEDAKVLSFAEWRAARRSSVVASDEAVVADEDIPF